MRFFQRLAAAGLALLALACGTAEAQRTPVYQSGALTAGQVGSIAKFFSNGLIGSAGDLEGDVNGSGLGPFSITDSLGLGLCSRSGPTNLAYWALCLGHDASGNALLTVDAYGGAAEKSFLIRKNGTLYEFPFTLSGIVGPATTVAGNVAVWNNAVGSLLRDEGAPAVLTVPTNAALKLLPGAAGRRVVRSGFTAAADGGGNVPYTWSASNCSAADDGKQVQPTAVTGCWIADFAGLKPTPKMWGAVGDGVANDRDALQAAITAMANNTLHLGPYKYKVNSSISSTAPMRIIGEGRSALGQFYSGIAAGTPNLNPIFSAGSQSYFGHFAIDAGASGANTSGIAIATAANAGNSIFEKIWIYQPCIGIDLNGGSQTVESVRIDGQAGTGCGGIRVGNLTTAGTTVDARIVNTTIQSDQVTRADFGMRVKDAGGLFVQNTDILSSVVGTEIIPGNGQHVEWSFFNNGILGDSTLNQGLVINTTHAGAVIRGLQFNNTWTSSSIASDGIGIANAALAPSYSGLSFIGHRSHNNYINGASVGATGTGGRVTFDAVRFCGNAQGPTGIGISIGANIGLVAVRNSTIADNCDGFAVNPNLLYAIALGGGNAATTIIGNELGGATTPVSGVPTGASVVADNVNLNTSIGTIASATSIALSTPHPTWFISGTTSIETITGGWVGREVKLISSTGAVPYATGGNICNAVTSASLGAVTAVWDNACWRVMN